MTFYPSKSLTGSSKLNSEFIDTVYDKENPCSKNGGVFLIPTRVTVTPCLRPVEITVPMIWILKVPTGAFSETVISPVELFTDTNVLLVGERYAKFE